MNILKMLEDCFLRLAGPSWTLISEPESPGQHQQFTASLRSLHCQTSEQPAATDQSTTVQTR